MTIGEIISKMLERMGKYTEGEGYENLNDSYIPFLSLLRKGRDENGAIKTEKEFRDTTLFDFLTEVMCRIKDETDVEKLRENMDFFRQLTTPLLLKIEEL